MIFLFCRSDMMPPATFEPDFSAPLPPPSLDSAHPQPSFPPVDYPTLLPTTPSLQQTSFTFPTPPHSDISSPQLSLSSPSSSTNNNYSTVSETPHAPASFCAPPNTCGSTLQVSADSLHTQLSLQDEAVSAPAFLYPNVLQTNTDPASVATQTFVNQHQAPPAAPSSSHSFQFPPVAQQMQTLSLPSVSPSPALSLPNLTHQTAPPLLPPSSFPHSTSTLPHSSFQPSSCLTVTSAAHPQSPSAASYACSYPPVGAIPRLGPAGPYPPEMVLTRPNLLPQLDPSLRSSAFPSYPLHLHQGPHPSLSNPFRHLYRQPQHPHTQRSYISTRTVF